MFDDAASLSPNGAGVRPEEQAHGLESVNVVGASGKFVPAIETITDSAGKQVDVASEYLYHSCSTLMFCQIHTLFLNRP
jgi:hypothetical protein